MLISSFAINVLSVALLLGFMLCLLGRHRQRTPATRALIRFLGGVLVVFLCFFVIFSTIDAGQATLAWCVLHAFVFAAIYMVQFAYAFPENPFPREAQRAFYVCVAAACVVYPWYLVHVAGLEPTYNFEGNLFVYLNTPEVGVVIGLEILWMFGVFVRKMRHFSRTAGETPSLLGLLLRPPERRTRALRDLFLLFFAPLVLVAAIVLAYVGRVSWVWVGHIIGTGFIITAFAFVVIYINHAAEPTTLMIKLIGISLGTVLVVFGLAANVALGIKEAAYLDSQRTALERRLPAGTVVTRTPVFRYTPEAEGRKLAMGFAYELAGERHVAWLSYRAYRTHMHRASLPLVAILMGAAAFVVAVFPLFFRHCLVRPMERLLGGVSRVNEGDLRVEVPVQVEDEIGYLAGSFNRMVRSIAQAQSDLKSALERQTELSDAYSCFVPRAFLASLEKSDITDIRLGDNVQRTMTILFSDIRSFTTLSEQMSPQENFDFINSYLGRISPVVRDSGGFIDKYLGDGVMALFPRAADDAVRAALAMRVAVAGLNRERAGRGLDAIRFGVGVHTGSMMLGTVGEAKRMDGTVISDAVNLAARLEGLTKCFGVVTIISQATLEALQDPDAFDVRRLGAVRVKGKNDHVDLYEVFSRSFSPEDEQKHQTRDRFAEALACYQDGDFDRARRLFEAVVAASGGAEPAAALYVQRCQALAERARPAGWDGVTDFDIK